MEDLKTYLPSLCEFLKKELDLPSLPKLKIIKNDKENGDKFLGKTGFYDPNNKSITLYTYGRHPKDCAKTVCHEIIHLKQDLEGRLNNISTTNINEDDYLKEIEREAYEKGNMLFRSWENNYKKNIKENKMTVKELRKLIREAIYNELNENEDKTWEIIYIDKGIQKSVLVKGYSAIVETNKWRNQNPDKEFIQIQLYSLNELEVKNEDPSTLKPAIVFDNNKKQHFISLVDKNGKVNSLGPIISEADVKKVNAGDTNDFCKKANQLYSNLDENAILENTNLKVVKVVDSCKLDENKHKNVSLLNLANEYVAEHGDVTPEELAKGLKIDLKTAKKLVMDLEDDFKNYYGNEEDLTEDLSSDIVNLDKQIDNLTKQIAPLQKKKADFEKQKADKSKIKADQEVKSAALTTEETANATGTGATMNSGTGEQYATPKAFKLKLKKK